jgi:protein involved in polysaccharide export with SLBB domain
MYRKLLTRLSAALVPCLLAGAAAAQTTEDPTAPPGTQTQSTRTTVDPVRAVISGPLLDRPLERARYRLGPGDVVDVAVFGEVELINTVAVTPEGTLVVPGVGVTRVLGLNLDEAQARVRELVYRLYRNVDVTLTLARIRSFKVFVVGDIANPGVRTATSVQRVSEVLPQEAFRGQSKAYRNVLVRRATGDSLMVDLARFSLMGDIDANPVLREGDAVVVRAMRDSIAVYGPVSRPGFYEYRPGETLAEFITLVNAGRTLPAGVGDTIRVSRFNPSGTRQIMAFSAADATGARGRGFQLRPFDAVYITAIANFGVQQVATITGQVRRPGTYPIRPDTTTVRELVALAGGFTPQASLAAATLRRLPVPGGRVRTGEDLASDSTRTQRERQVASIEEQSAVDETYVVLDFARLFATGEAAYTQTLQAGDSLSVPERRNDVAVLGAVGRPGLVNYVQGRNIQDYVNQAGGFNRRALWRETTVLRANTGARLLAREVTRIEPGDRIVVPFRERRTILERLQTTQSLVAIISGAALTIASLVALF